jgi:hypothetical protein
MTARERRVITLGAVAIGVAVVVTRGIPAAGLMVGGLRHEVSARTELLSRLRRQVATGADLTDSAAALRAQLGGLVSAILAGHTSASALEELNAHVVALAQNGGALVRRAEPVADSSRAGFLRRVALRLDLECDLRGLLEVLRAMDYDSTAIGADAVHIVPVNPLAPTNAPEVLNVELQVSGWYVDSGARRVVSAPDVRRR